MFFEAERIAQTIKVLKGCIITAKQPVTDISMRTGAVENFLSELKQSLPAYKSFGRGELWGGKDLYVTFRVTVEITAEMQDQPIVLLITTGREDKWEALNPQFIVWTADGVKQGIDVNHREIHLTEKACVGERFTVLMEGWSGLEEMSCFFHVDCMSINREIEGLYYDLLVAHDVVLLPSQSATDKEIMLDILTRTQNLLDLRNLKSEAFFESVTIAREFLKQEFYDNLAGNPASVYCTGHSHIDVAWQWRVCHSRRKATRSFATAIDFMRRYPDYCFSSSQPQLYDFIRQDYPEFYELIKQQIREGRFEAEGAMWLEADCNLISGESMVRQLIHGKRFFRKQFGVDSRVLWLPDVFGYSAAMPQILKKSGVDYFITSKISWNEYNRMPHDTFMWRGIDGTEILTYFHTMPDSGKPERNNIFATYSGMIRPDSVAGAWEKYKDKRLSKNILASFGYGDGGGGPTNIDLEYAKRLKNGLPGVPAVKMTKILPFMEKLSEDIAGNSRLTSWSGELYLEFHRGTYTSMARNKKYNRNSETSLHNLELAGAMKEVLTRAGDYPADEVDGLWELVLLNQFHDIIPGSSIGEVYLDSEKQYQYVLEKSRLMTSQILREICDNNAENHDTITAFNFLPIQRNDVIVFQGGQDNTALVGKNGECFAIQRTHDGQSISYICDIPSMGLHGFDIVYANAPEFELIIDEHSMENKFFALVFDENCEICSIWDKRENRQIISKNGRANTLKAYEDRPRDYDAWEITAYYRDKEYAVDNVISTRIVETGPVRAGIEISRRFMSSEITQIIFIYNDIPRIDFQTKIDWKESHILLKVGFPVDIHAEEAMFDVQFGNVARPTHSNTSWDFAKFEVCAHKWADLSERNYGAALLNDSKYGYRVKDGNLELTLIKSATFPYEMADKELHEFTYSLYPHVGDFARGDVHYQAQMLNSPLYFLPHKVKPALDCVSFFAVNARNVFIETVKPAYDGHGIIIRLVEFQNIRCSCELSVFGKIKAAFECDLLENNIDEIKLSYNSAVFHVKPYEIKTIRVLLT